MKTRFKHWASLIPIWLTVALLTFAGMHFTNKHIELEKRKVCNQATLVKGWCER